MIKLKNLTVSFDSKKVLENLSLSLEPGSIYLLLGKNGAGKTTLIKCLAGLIETNDEQVLIDSLSPIEIQEKIGFYLPESMLFADLTVEENLNFFGDISAKNKKFSFTESKYTKWIFDLNDKKVKTLSQGERAKVSITRTFLKEPQYIFLDEPTAFLDNDSIKEFLVLLKELDNQSIVVIATHSPEIWSAEKIWSAELCNLSQVEGLLGCSSNHKNSILIKKLPTTETSTYQDISLVTPQPSTPTNSSIKQSITPLTSLISKDLKTELSINRLIISFTTIIVLSLLVEIAVQSSLIMPEDRKKILIPLAWLIFFVTQLFQASKMFEPEKEHRANLAIFNSATSLSFVYFSKLLTYSALNFLILVFTFLLFQFFWSTECLEAKQFLGLIFSIGIPEAISLTSITLIIGATSLGTDRSPLLNPITVIPLLLPLFVIGIEFSYNIADKMDILTSTMGIWLLTLVYLTLTYLIFPIVYKQQR